MRQKTIRVVLSLAVVICALAGLISLSLQETAAYYKHVDEVMSAPDQWYEKNLQLHGHVVDGSIMRRPNTLDYRFTVEANGKIVQASYTGIVPDTFKGGSEVVLKGRLSPHGFAVEPNGVMAKCPSKYEAASKPGSTVGGSR
jgi:cytochrome c-type biogenesis protein CcmE